MYNQNLGTAQVHFFVKRPDGSANPTAVRNSKAQFFSVNQSDSAAAGFRFDTKVIPYDELRQNGFSELANSGRNISGFKTVAPQENYLISLIALVLVTVLPVAIFVPLIAFFLSRRNKHRLLYLETRLDNRLQETLASEKAKKTEKSSGEKTPED